MNLNDAAEFSSATPEVYRFPFPAFPNGWFPVALSHEVSQGDVIPLHRCGEDIVVFRTEDGVAGVVGAYCPHLGAHIGYGGTVHGEMIQCPFHHWRFDVKGKCMSAAGTERVPKRCLKEYQVVERNGAIFIWHDEKNRNPWWEIPEIPEASSADYKLVMGKTYEFPSHPQEAFENQPDTLHLVTLHGYNIEEWSWDCDDITTSLRLTIGGHDCVDEALSENTVEVRAFGPSYNISRFTGKIPAVSVFLYTPTSPGHVYNPVMFWVKITMSDEESAAWSNFILELYEDDIPVWTHKRYASSPSLTPADGPIVAMRKWYKRWYE